MTEQKQIKARQSRPNKQKQVSANQADLKQAGILKQSVIIAGFFLVASQASATPPDPEAQVPPVAEMENKIGEG